MIAAVAGVHQPIQERRAIDDRLLVADLLHCDGWSCDGETYADAIVVDGDAETVVALHVDGSLARLALNQFCVDCLPVGAGWWARSRPRVSVVWPVDSTVYRGDQTGAVA